MSLRLLTLAWRASAAVTRWLALRRVIAIDRARVKAGCDYWVEITDSSGSPLATIAIERPFPGLPPLTYTTPEEEAERCVDRAAELPDSEWPQCDALTLGMVLGGHGGRGEA
jgi:hypothetical protein